MRAVILAAGRGQRLGPLTVDTPKALVEFSGTPLLVRQLEVLRSAGISDITVVVGYRHERFDGLGVRTVANPEWETTNMVGSLMCAGAAFDGDADVLIAYSDILYEHRLVAAMLDSRAEVSTLVDVGWRELWGARMAEPLSDAESMRIRADGCIAELGGRPQHIEDIQGQYVGLTKVAASFAKAFVTRYRGMAAQAGGTALAVRQMYMTAYLQQLIDDGVCVRAVPARHGWIEIDTLADMAAYSAMLEAGTLSRLFDLDACPPRG